MHMKGYNLNGTLYIFDATPATIPGDAGDKADLIYVQQELVEEFKSENTDNAAKIKPYNYKLMAVNKLTWTDYINEDILEKPELAWSAESATAQIGETNTFPTLTNSHSVTVTYSSSDSEKATIDATTGEITLVAAGDTIISAIFVGDDTYEAQTVTYTLTVQAAQPVEPTEYTVSANFGQTLLEDHGGILHFSPSMPYSAVEGTQLVFRLSYDDWYVYKDNLQIQYPESIQDYEIKWPYEDESDDDDPLKDGTLSFTMPAENVTLNIDYK